MTNQIGGHTKGKDCGGPTQRRVEEEYGEPFLDVLVGFAAMGYSIDITAKTIGYSRTSFRRLLKRRAADWVITWPARDDPRIPKMPVSEATRANMSKAAIKREAKARIKRREVWKATASIRAKVAQTPH